MEQIIKLQNEYFEFCLRLLQLVPQGEFPVEQLSREAYVLRDQLKEAITVRLRNYKEESILELESEINRMKELLRNGK